MDLDVIITEDPLLKELRCLNRKRVNFLAYNGIITIEDFLDANISLFACSSDEKKQLRGLQTILRYKYFNEPIPQSVILDDVYYVSGHASSAINNNNFCCLGFVPTKDIAMLINVAKANATSRYIKIIDILKVLSYSSSGYNKFLASFYLDYYDEEKEKEAGKLNKETLDSYNNILKDLIHKRDLLDKEIEIVKGVIKGIENGEYEHESESY